MTFSRNRKPAARSLTALFYAVILLAPAAVTLAAEPLTPQERQDLTQALAKLTASEGAMAAMVSECSGGSIMVLACSPPPPGSTHPPGCNERVASCDLVAALHETDAAIASLQKALKQ